MTADDYTRAKQKWTAWLCRTCGRPTAVRPEEVKRRETGLCRRCYAEYLREPRPCS